jgi:hypothetical protein
MDRQHVPGVCVDISSCRLVRHDRINTSRGFYFSDNVLHGVGGVSRPDNEGAD